MALFDDFTRPTDDRMIAGVCSGIARRLGIDAGIVRAVLVVLVMLPVLGWWVYPVLWLVMPAEGSTTSGLDRVVSEAKDLNDRQKAKKDPTVEVFNPYRDEDLRP